jgi:DMSO reductase family type II enzyme chaperone
VPPPGRLAPAKPALEANDPPPSETELALCRSALWEALALGFRPPVVETVERLTTPEGSAALADAAAMLDASDGGDLAGLARALGEPSRLAVSELRSDYARLFGHTARGLVPPYETEYGDDSVFMPAREMSDLSAFFRAFGVQVRHDAHERPDHIACECEFMVLLARKEAYALEAGEADTLRRTREAVRYFLREHLGRWGPAFGARLAREDASGFYGRLGALAAAFVIAECARTGVAAGPPLVRLRSADPPDAPMACGPATEEGAG